MSKFTPATSDQQAMTNIITYNSTIDAAAWEIAQEILEYYAGNSMPRIIGFTDQGEVDYEYTAIGGDVTVPVYNTESGWGFGDTDPDEGEDGEWSDDVTAMVAELITDTLQRLNEYEYQVCFRDAHRS